MIKQQRLFHRLAWLFLLPLMAASIWLSVSNREGEQATTVAPYADQEAVLP